MNPRTRLIAAIAVVAVIAAGLGVAVVLTGDGDNDDVATGDTTTTETTARDTTTTTTRRTTTTAAAVDASTAVWPWAESATRYDQPEEAAAGFATDYLGFVDPVVGDYRAGDARSGEVDIRPEPGGPVTTVIVRQLGPDDTWWVLGASAEDIVVDEPDAVDAITSPVLVEGRAQAFEGHVDVAVRQDGRPAPLGTGFVTGASDRLGPFRGEISFDDPTASHGAVVFTTTGGEDNRIWQASVVRIRFDSPT